MTQTTNDKVPPRSGRGKCEYRSPTDAERAVLRAHGYRPWGVRGGVEGSWESGKGAGWLLTLWTWDDGPNDIDALMSDRDSGASVRVQARNIVALFALMERFGDTIWNPPEAA